MPPELCLPSFAEFATPESGTRVVAGADITSMIREHAPAVRRILRRAGIWDCNADDAVQEVFIAAARNLAKIELGKERAYLMSTALLKAANLRRVQNTKQRWFQETLTEPIDPHSHADERLVERERRILLDAALAKLPEKFRDVLILSEFGDLSNPEIAAALQLALGTVASRLSAAKKMLIKELRNGPAL